MNRRDEFCDNSSRFPGHIVRPQCRNGGREFSVLVEYDEHGIDSDTSTVCGRCKEKLVELAERHGYATTVTALEGAS